MDILGSIIHLVELVQLGEIEVYNEISVQHELGIILRSGLPEGLKIQFERPVDYFGLNRNDFVKREIDITAFSLDKSTKHAVEIKYPRNGQYPEQMFSSCKDILFLEQLLRAGFSTCHFLMLADDPLFYERGSKIGIYENFRGNKPISGTIRKPTHPKDKLITISGTYSVIWKSIRDSLKSFSLKIQN